MQHLANPYAPKLSLQIDPALSILVNSLIIRFWSVVWTSKCVVCKHFQSSHRKDILCFFYFFLAVDMLKKKAPTFLNQIDTNINLKTTLSEI